MVFGRHVLETLVAEIEEEVAGRTGKTNNTLTGQGATVAIRHRWGHLITKGTLFFSTGNIYISHHSQINAPTFDLRCVCHASLVWKCWPHAAQAKSSDGQPLSLMVGSQGEWSNLNVEYFSAKYTMYVVKVKKGLKGKNYLFRCPSRSDALSKTRPQLITGQGCPLVFMGKEAGMCLFLKPATNPPGLTPVINNKVIKLHSDTENTTELWFTLNNVPGIFNHMSTQRFASWLTPSLKLKASSCCPWAFCKVCFSWTERHEEMTQQIHNFYLTFVLLR